jgi:nucleoside-diphosphate-sugar epimerase
MGGMGFISNHKADCMMSVLINTHLLLASKNAGASRYFFASSACVYPDYRQMDSDIPGLKEEDSYPAMPEDGYGWEKLFSERLCRHYREDFGLETRIARFHNVYGPEGTFDGGREKAPAAICRKVANAVQKNETQIEIWGDGNQTRSFMYIDDCLNGIEKIMHGDFADPINLGSSESVTINQLLEIVSSFTSKHFTKRHDLSAPQGVRGRNSDNTLIKEVFDWEPTIPLEVGLKATYDWIDEQIKLGNTEKFSRF